jgi:hypothetical protein
MGFFTAFLVNNESNLGFYANFETFNLKICFDAKQFFV